MRGGLYNPIQQHYVLGQELRVGKYYSPYPTYLRRDEVTTMTANRLYGAPHIIIRRQTIDRIAVQVQTLAAASHIRLGIYDSKDIYPNNLILDAGVIDSSTTGFKTIVIDQQLPPGLYWFAAISDDAPRVYSNLSAYDQGAVVMGNEGESMYFSPVAVFKSAVGYAPLPNPFPAAPTEERYRGLNLFYRLASLD